MTLQWSIHQANLDPVHGSEQAGARPVLIISRESISRPLGLVGVVPLTSLKPGRRIYPTEVLLHRGTAGLTSDSLVLAHQIRVLSSARLGRKYGQIEDEVVRSNIREAVRLFLDLQP